MEQWISYHHITPLSSFIIKPKTQSKGNAWKPLDGKPNNINNLQTSLPLFLFVLSLFHLSLPCSLRHFLSIQMPFKITPFWSNSIFFSLLLPFFLWTAQVCHLNLTFYLLFSSQFFRYCSLMPRLVMTPQNVWPLFLFLVWR